MKIKTLLSLLVVLVLFIPSIAGCSPPAQIENFFISISHAPKVGETAEVTLKYDLRYATRVLFENKDKETVKARVWAEFRYANTKGSYLEALRGKTVPLDQVLVEGSLEWEGNPFQSEDIVELRGKIKFPWEGVWDIKGYSIVSAKGIKDYKLDKDISLAVSKDAAAIIGSREFWNGPLAYLGNFSYGQSGEPVPNDLSPVIVDLDLSKAPLVGEEAVLTCYILSLHDVGDVSIDTYYFGPPKNNKMPVIPGKELLVNGDLSWSGDLKAGKQAVFNATLQFPEEGNWTIHVQGDTPEHESKQHLGFAREINLNIDEELSYFGWKQK